MASWGALSGFGYVSFGAKDTFDYIQYNLSTGGSSSNVEVGDVAILAVAKDNYSSTDGNTSEITVTDSKSNTWVKLREYTYSRGAQQGGATVALFYCWPTTSITSAGNDWIKASFSPSQGGTNAKCMTYGVWTPTSANGLVIQATASDLGQTGADPGSMAISGLASAEYLFVRATAIETNSTNSITYSTGGGTWNSLGVDTRTSGGGAASNMGSVSEYLIATATGATSDPTYASGDCASIMLALKLTFADSRSVAEGSATAADTPSAVWVRSVSTSEGSATAVDSTDWKDDQRATSEGSATAVDTQTAQQTSNVGVTEGASTAVDTPMVYQREPLGGAMEFRMYFSGGGINQNPRLSIGGAASQQDLGVVSRQRANFSTTPTITGVVLEECAGNSLGNGTLAYNRAQGKLSWTSNGSTQPSYIFLGSDGHYVLGDESNGYLVVRIINGQLPLANATDTVVITNHMQNLFDDVLYNERSAGKTEYRGVYLRNHTGLVIASLTLTVDAQPAEVGTISLALEAGEATFGTLNASEVEFGGVRCPFDMQQWYEGSGYARTDLANYYNPTGDWFFYGAPVVSNTGSFFSDGISVNILSQLSTEDDPTGVLSGMSWGTSKTVTNMQPGDYIPIWVRRVIPQHTPTSEVPDSFRLKIMFA